MSTFVGTIADLAHAGHAPTDAELETWHDALNALTGQLSTFASTWRSTGTAPALGNGTLVGRYFQAGALVVGRITLTPGSTSTFGTGSYNFDLPTTLLSGNQWQSLGACTIRDSSGALTYALSAFSASSTTVSAANGSGNRLGALSPITLASADTIDFWFSYESA